MKLTCLLENTASNSCLAAEHGLSVLVETKRHVVLFDSGASRAFAENAKIMGIDLTRVDTAVLSHGHSDHGGGLPYFLKENAQAKIYLRGSAFGEFISCRDGQSREISLPRELFGEERLIIQDTDLRLDEELFLFGDVKNTEFSSFANRTLYVKEGTALRRDEFSHEQNLVVFDEGRTALLCGCSHSGIVNIIEAMRLRLGKYPNAAIGGFHLMQEEYSEEELDLIRRMAARLKTYPTVFYTCHCTGQKAFLQMREIMGEQLQYFSGGDILTL